MPRRRGWANPPIPPSEAKPLVFLAQSPMGGCCGVLERWVGLVWVVLGYTPLARYLYP